MRLAEKLDCKGLTEKKKVKPTVNKFRYVAGTNVFFVNLQNGI
jgi:hypothetical protein